MTEDDLRVAVARVLPGVTEDLVRLARIPGIAFDGFDHSQVQRSAEAVAELLRGAGLPDVRIVRKNGQPAVIGRRPAPPGAPTVLLYAHHDVQPIGDESQWLTPPFEPTVVGERLFGRGCADDKAGVLAHVAALRAFGDALPVGVVVFVEGEEEFGSESLEDLIREHREELSADVIVIADSGNWDIGVPALTTSLRGIVNLFVDVAVPGLVSGPAAPLEYPLDRFRTEAGMLPDTELIGTGRLVDRLWTKPALAVLGIDAPRTSEAPNALVPTARAKVSLRLAPGDDPRKAYEAIKGYLEAQRPWGATVQVSLEQLGDACQIDATGPAYDAVRAAFRTAWDGVEPVEIGVGGSIPFIATFQELFPRAAILVTGVEDPYSAAHGPDESLHLGEFQRVCLAEALLLKNVAEALTD